MDYVEYKIGDTVTIHQKITGENRKGVENCTVIENSPVFVEEMENCLNKKGKINKISEIFGRKRYRVEFKNMASWWFDPESFKEKDFTKRNLILSKINKNSRP